MDSFDLDLTDYNMRYFRTVSCFASNRCGKRRSRQQGYHRMHSYEVRNRDHARNRRKFQKNDAHERSHRGSCYLQRRCHGILRPMHMKPNRWDIKYNWKAIFDLHPSEHNWKLDGSHDCHGHLRLKMKTRYNQYQAKSRWIQQNNFASLFDHYRWILIPKPCF